MINALVVFELTFEDGECVCVDGIFTLDDWPPTSNDVRRVRQKGFYVAACQKQTREAVIINIIRLADSPDLQPENGKQSI